VKRTSPLIVAMLLASCSGPAPPAADTTRYNTDIAVNEVMAHVVNPAAFQFWKGSGESYSKGHVEDLSPQTEEAWKSVEDGAAIVVIAMNTLKTPGYARKPTIDWNRHADEIATIAMQGKMAAEKQDKVAIATIGEKLDEACENCHRQFDPNYGKR